MQPCVVLLASIACLASATPHPLGPGTLAYFKLLGQRYEKLQGRIPKKYRGQDNVASCNDFDLSTAEFPSLPEGLPAPSGTPYHVAIGRGTQNYTCEAFKDDSSAIPVAAGATARLFNLSCGATIAPSQTSALSAAAIEHPLSSLPEDPLFPGGPTANMAGYHYFSDATTPTFNLDMGDTNYGIIRTKLDKKAPAPEDPASKGFWPYTDSAKPNADQLRNTTAVAWLRLTVPTMPAVDERIASENKGNVVEVYRINTAGGSPPKDCSGYPDGGHFELPYAAAYWFFA